MSWRLTGGRVLDPSTGEDQVRDLCIDGGRIVDDAPGATRVDCDGAWICPGFVDLHGDLADPAADGLAAAMGGYATVCAIPRPACDHPDGLGSRARALSAAPVEVLMAGALTVGLAGEALAEIGGLLAAGAAALSNDRDPIRDVSVLRNAMQYAAGFGQTPILLRAAEPGLEGGPAREGDANVLLGLAGTPPEAEAIGVWRAALLAARVGARVHLTHLWSRAGVEALRGARKRRFPVTASTTAYHLAVDPMQIAPRGYPGVWHFLPPLGDADDRTALREALQDGTLAGVATDHRPLPAVRQDAPLQDADPGAAGYAVALPLVLGAGLSPLQAVRALSTGPSEALGRVPHGLAPGSPAMVTVVDPGARWTVDAASWPGARNQPLAGDALVGRVLHTFVAGAPWVTRGMPSE